MNKIKKFKISLRRKIIAQKILRSGADLKSAGVDGEFELDTFTASLYSALDPGVVYRLFEANSPEAAAAGLQYGGAFSACVLTLGPGIEEKIKTLSPVLQTAANIALSEFLKTAVQFTADLIKDQALKEDFETGNIEILYSPPFVSANENKFLQDAPRVEPATALKAAPFIFDAVNAAKINASFENGAAMPKATAAFLVPRTAKKRKKK